VNDPRIIVALDIPGAQEALALAGASIRSSAA
jgi:hypothetical protein